MAKRALFAAAGCVGLCLSLSAQPTQGAEEPQLDGSTLEGLPLGWPSLSLEDRESFFFSNSFGWTQPRADFLPSFNPVQPQSVAHRNVPGRRNLDDNDNDNVVDLRSTDRIHVGGEIGFLYGRSSGKYGVEYERGYVIGEVGNDYFHLTVGTSYERLSGRVPRWGR